MFSLSGQVSGTWPTLRLQFRTYSLNLLSCLGTNSQCQKWRIPHEVRSQICRIVIPSKIIPQPYIFRYSYIIFQWIWVNLPSPSSWESEEFLGIITLLKWQVNLQQSVYHMVACLLIHWYRYILVANTRSKIEGNNISRWMFTWN